MITCEVIFRNGGNLLLGPFPGWDETIEEMLDRTRGSGTAADWKITTYPDWQQFERNQKRKLRKAPAVIAIFAGIILAVAVAFWSAILF